MKSHASTPKGKPEREARAPAAKRATRAPAAKRTTRARPEDVAPERFVDGYLAALLAQASHLISSEFHEIVAANGFTVSEWRVLATLAGGEAISIGRLAEIAVIKQRTVTRLLDRMAARGHVERLASADDRRVTLVRITPGGDRLVARLIALASEHEQRVLQPLGRAGAEALKQTLRGIIEQHRPPAREA